ncbi:MAG: tetratricopeptide repeat protein [Verrucomicrobia bacterium]|nr:tetratricopeptide repeat protein [Verrucomicrobiota bacterium]
MRASLIAGSALAVALGTPLLRAQSASDFFTLLSGEQRAVAVTRVDRQNLFYKTPSGELPQPLRSLKTWGLVERPTVKPALKAVADGQYAQAVPALKQIVDAFLDSPAAGLQWVADSSVALVRAYSELKQYGEADAVAKKFMASLPNEINRVKPYLAIALAGQGKFDDAITLLQDVVKTSDKKLAVTPTESRSFGQAYLALGDCYAGKGDGEKAIEAYLTTAVLYFHDESLARQAQAKADEWKKKVRPAAEKPAAL